ncbi:MAG TPA: cellulose synthase subunit BcsC-related outer membrane protein [Burkholderiaceae bacterium]|nr:cellulose synthase subunit BcsC-related outer membrane protein [Burkholderiaceae bacterium]
MMRRALRPDGRCRLRQAAFLWTALLFVLLTPSAARPEGVGQRAVDQEAVAELLRSARLWQALENPDAERQVLRKLLAVAPDQPRALFLLGELELRAGHIEQGRRALEKLKHAPDSAALARELEALVRIYTQERARLSKLRLYVRGGNQARALALARALFPDGRPPGDLANEFALVLAGTPGGWLTMRELLQERIHEDPNPRDRLTLYEVLALHAETRDEALQGFAELARSHDVDPQRVAAAWRHALLAVASDEEGLAQRRLFLSRYPSDAEVRAQVEQIEAQQLAERELQNDPGVELRQAAERSMQEGRLDDADAELARSLQLRPNDAETVGTLGLVRLRQGRAQEALAQFEQAAELERNDPARRARWLDLTKTARYWSALARARELRDAGQFDEAARLVESVRGLQPDEVEDLHLLASLRVAQKQDAQAERIYRDLLARDPRDVRAWRGLLSLWLEQGRVQQALDEAQQLPLTYQIAPEAVLDAGTLRDAISLAGAPHPDTQMRLLERSVELLPREAWLRYDLARLYLRFNLPTLAREVMEEGERIAPQDAQMRYAAALIDSASGRDEEALAKVQGIAQEQQSPGMRELTERLRFEHALQLARDARAQGQAGEDERWRNEALAYAADDPARVLRVARADLWAGDVASARVLIDRVAAAQVSLEPEQRRDLAAAMIEADEPERALLLIDELGGEGASDARAQAQLALLRARAHHAQRNAPALREDFRKLHEMLPGDDVEMHIEALSLMDDDRATAHEWMAELLRAHPTDPEVLLEAARQDERDHNWAAAAGYLRAVAGTQVQAAPPAAIPVLLPGAAPLAAAAPPQGDVQTRASRELATIEARRQPQIDVGFMQYWRNATDGLSTLRGTEIPVVVQWPGGYDGHWFAQVDSVRAYAGTLPAPLAFSSQFGQVLALAPAGLTQSVYEQAKGFSAEMGWRGDERRFDLGVVGMGFPVSNIVGGLRQSATWHDTDVSAEISRRVLTASLLSYAGAVDPVSGATWGGVTDTALVLRGARPLAHGWGLSASLSAGVATGRNVQSNPNVELRAAADRDWVRRPNFVFNAGLAASYWHYQYNEDFYTYGQGGYYSPQQYVSFGVPAEAQGRRGALSYDLRVVPSWAWSYLQTAPYYPTDASLQERAGNPVYTSGTGSGGGPAASLRAALEYRSSAHWSVGGWLDIDRSAYYAPNQVMVYLRYWIDPQTGPVAFPPRGVQPISRF